MKTLSTMIAVILLLTTAVSFAQDNDKQAETVNVKDTQVKVIQVEAVQTKATQITDTQAKTTSAKTTLAKTTQAKTTPAKTTPAKTTPAKTTPAKTTPAKTTPAKTTPAKTTPATDSVVKQSKGTLLFFLNPNGYPCQQQDKIIKENLETISGMADVSYIATTDAMSKFSFNRYGVRRLPSIILLNAKGEISKYFPPGIRSSEEILTALKSM